VRPPGRAPLDLVGNHRRHVAPLAGVPFDAQQVEQQIEIQLAQRGVRDGRHPFLDPPRRIVGHALDFDCQRAGRGELAGVRIRHELLVGIRHQHVGGPAPQILEPRLAADVRFA
jgi:hypothetical protein